jgi:hypothetical protein
MTYKGFQKKKPPIYQFPLLVSAVRAISSPHVCAVPVTVSLAGLPGKKKKRKAKLRHLILLSRVTY